MLIIGLTKPDREERYNPMMDGYRPGAQQDTIHLPELAGEYDLEEIAEAVFDSMNNPGYPSDSLASRIRDMMVAADIKCRSLSVGDTITYEGLGMVWCARTGWEWVGMHGD